VTAILSGSGLPGVYLATIAAGAFRVAMYWWSVRRIGLRPDFPARQMIVGRLFREGWAIALGSFLQLAYQNLDKIIVSVALSTAETAYLTAAVVIVFGVVELTNTALLVALFPAMSRLAGENPRALLRMVDNFAFLTLVITLPLGVGISLLSDTLAGLFFPKFIGTASVLSILIWQGVVSMIAGIYTQSLYVRSKQRTQLLIRVCGLVINGCANLILIPTLGVRGAAFAALLAQSTVLALCLYEHRTLMLAGRSARAIFAAVCMAGVMFLLRDVQFILAGIAGVGVYAAVLFGLRTLAPEHWGVLRTIGSALPIIGRVIMRAT
jgi:O-antigen/teichoic acid export membrane protein